MKESTRFPYKSETILNCIRAVQGLGTFNLVYEIDSNNKFKGSDIRGE